MGRKIADPEIWDTTKDAARTPGDEGTWAALRRVFVSRKGFLAAFFFFLVICWLTNPFHFVSDDSYFYLVIARNIALHGDQTFSGLFPTNGVHPLWLYVLALYNWFVALINPDWLQHVGFAVPLSALFLGMGMVNLFAVARNLAVDGLPVVVFSGGFLAAFGVLYSEAHLFFFSLSLLLLISTNGTIATRFGAVIHGLVSAMVFLSRLDAVFLVAACYIWFLLVQKNRSDIMWSGAVFLIFSVPYILSNIFIFGGIMPVSGWLQSSFPALRVGGIVYNGGLSLSFSGYSIIFGILPIIASMLVLALWRRHIARYGAIIYALLLGSLLHCLYIVLFVPVGNTYYWYYVLPVVLGAFAFAFLIKYMPALKVPARLVTILFVVFISAMAIEKSLGSLISSQDRKSLHIAEEVIGYIQDHAIQEQVILVSDMPGRIAFFSDNYVIADDMLTANRRIVDGLVQHPDSLEYLSNYCRDRGKPIEYFFLVDSQFLLSDEERISIQYVNPRISRNDVIGKRYMGAPVYNSSSLVVWKW